MLLITIVTLIVSYTIALETNPSKIPGCIVSVQNGFGKPQPLVLNANATDFIKPADRENLNFAKNEVATFACPGGTIRLNGRTTKNEQVKAKCLSDTSFQLQGDGDGKFYFKEITCTKNPFHLARFTGQECLKGNREIEIGFVLKDTSSFLQTIKICFDDNKKLALYAQFNASNRMDSFQTKYPRPSFIQGDFYNFGSLNSLYKRKSQRKNINRLLGLPDSSTKYITQSDDFFLSRGHIVAKADFIYGPAQSSTFHYVNIAPQWQTLNGRNWNKLEMEIRKFASTQANDLVMYSGTHGITTLPHEETGEDIPLYVYASGNNYKLPVPQLFWKILHDPVTNRAAAFVGINNPYHKEVDKEIICTDICDKLPWLKWNPHNAKNGYSYCCTVEELRQVVDNVPQDIVVGDLLT